jgi:tetratricopeptide (TPR) repeat protein
MLRLLTLATAYALLIACAGNPPVSDTSGAQAQAVATDETPDPPAAAEPKPAERAIPDDSVYPLLVAEFALRRRAYDVALDNYLVQSRILRDAGISAHTTHLTQFMQREQEALEASQLWVELAPDNAEANSTLATLLVRQGRTLDALPHLAVVQRSEGSANFPMLFNGFDQLDDQQRAELVSGINQLAEEFPASTQLLLTQALIHTEFDQYPEALDKLEALFELQPDQPQAMMLEARILLAEKAKKPFYRVQRVLEENPTDTRLRLQYARLLTTVDMTAAREQFEVLSSQSPRDGDLLFSLALISREIGDDDAAMDYLRQMLSLEQRVDEAHYYLGRIAEDQDRPQDAVAQYKQVKEGREFFIATNRIGLILIDSGQLDESRGWFELQRRENPDWTEQLYSMEADILIQAGAGEAAMAVLNQALAEQPDSSSLLYARSMLGEQQNDLALMESDLRTIIASDPGNSTALNALGYTLANRTERLDEAYDLITRALELAPDEPAILDSMGWVLYRTGRHEEALEYLTRAYAVFPDPEVAAHLGEVLWATGATDAATSVWRGALAKDPGNKILLDTLRRLNADAVVSTLSSAGPPP